jgi:ankyrin repeat protein
MEEQNNGLDEELLDAAEVGDLGIVKRLINKGANVNAKAEDFRTTPLMFAATNGYVEMAQFLIDNGANINDIDDLQKTPLMYAAASGRLEIERLLIKNGANVDATNDNLRTALIYAVRNGKLASTRLLIDNGANVNHVDSSGLTPLIYTASIGGENSVAIARLLIEKGARVNAALRVSEIPLNMIQSDEDYAIDLATLLIKTYIKKGIPFEGLERANPIIKEIIKREMTKKEKRDEDAIKAAIATYHSMRQKGIPKDVARYLIMKNVMETKQDEAWDIPEEKRKEEMRRRIKKTTRKRITKAPRKKQRKLDEDEMDEDEI